MGVNRALIWGMSGWEERRASVHLKPRWHDYQRPGWRSLNHTSSPRKAGTHNHRAWLSSKPAATAPHREAAANGSLLSQGRQFTPPAQLFRQRELQQQRALEHGEIVVGNHGQQGVALRRDMGVDAFHVVDLVAQICLEDRGAIDHRAGGERLERDAADADAEARCPRKFSLQHQKLAIWQQHRVADIEIIASDNAELPRRRAADQKRDDVAVAIKPALGD